MNNNKLEKLKRYLTKQISSQIYNKISDYPDRKFDDYYSVFLKYGDQMISVGEMNVISFMSQTLDKKNSYITLIFSLPVHDDNSDKKSSDQILQVIHLIEKAIGSCDSVHYKQDKHFLYIHVTKRMTIEMYYKLDLVKT